MNITPVMYSDISGEFPILALLAFTAFVGLGLTIGGVASDDNLMTAIGLSLIVLPAMIAGGLAAFATTGSFAHVVGAVTLTAGVGTSVFASAEWQQYYTGDNWILNTGLSEGLYNGLMIGVASVATIGTAVSCFAYAHNINSIVEYGRYGKAQYRGVKITQKTSSGTLRTRTVEFHTHAHKGYNPHWQVNKWDRLSRRGAEGRWKLWFDRIR